MTLNPSFANSFGGLLGDGLPAPDPTQAQPTGLLPPQPIRAGLLDVPVDPGSIFAPPASPRYGLGGGPQPQGLLGLSGLNSVSPFAAQIQAPQPMSYSIGAINPLAQFLVDPFDYARITLLGQDTAPTTLLVLQRTKTIER